MASVKIVESIADTPYGSLYIKEWLPNELSSDIPIIMLHNSLGCFYFWKRKLCFVSNGNQKTD
jgi:hypothetical protein